jgi:hypothetical protein
MKVFAALILFLSLLAAQQQKRVFWAFRTPVKADVPALGIRLTRSSSLSCGKRASNWRRRVITAL